MGQVEVYAYLKRLRASGDKAFYTVRQIELGLSALGYSNGCVKGVRGDLWKLTAMGYCDTKRANGLLEWPGRFRFKLKCLRKGKRRK